MSPNGITSVSNGWKHQLVVALLKVENLHLLAGEKEALSPQVRVLIPDDIRLFNLKVWTLRYAVSTEFILEFLLYHYFKKQRTLPKDPLILTLGVSIGSLTSVSARCALEEFVMNSFPVGENQACARQELLQQINPRPPLPSKLNYQNLEEMATAYDKVMSRRHRESPEGKTFPRPFRGCP